MYKPINRGLHLLQLPPCIRGSWELLLFIDSQRADAMHTEGSRGCQVCAHLRCFRCPGKAIQKCYDASDNFPRSLPRLWSRGAPLCSIVTPVPSSLDVCLAGLCWWFGNFVFLYTGRLVFWILPDFVMVVEIQYKRTDLALLLFTRRCLV